MGLDGGRQQDVAGEVDARRRRPTPATSPTAAMRVADACARRPRDRRPAWRPQHGRRATLDVSPIGRSYPLVRSRHDATTLRLGAFFFGGVELDDAGAGPPAPMDRRFTNEQVWKATDRLRQLGAWRPSASATTRSGPPSTTSSTRATRSSPTASSCRRGSPPAPSGSASARCSTSCRSGTRCASPRTSRRCTTCPAAGRSSASAAAPCRARCCTSTTRACRSAPTTTPTRPPTTTATGGCSRSRWRSSAWRSPTRRSPTSGEFFQLPVPGIPDRGSTVQDAHARAAAAVPVRDLAGRHQPADAGVRPGRRPRRGVLEPAPRVHQALLGHLRRALRRGPRRPRAGRRTRSGCSSSSVRIEDTHEKAVRDGDAGPRRVLEVPRPVRVEPRLHGPRRQAGAGRADPDARRVDREQDDPRSARPTRSPRASPSTATCSASST